MAAQQFEAGVEMLTAELMARLRATLPEFDAKLKASAAH
jgi:hypothetical protein